MGKYSIKDLETLSGIKAHTIRIWEKRYGVITPDRTDTNIRTYCDSDLKKLLNIALLNNNGLKISKISELDEDSICQEVERIGLENYSESTQIDRLVVSMVDLDRPKFEEIMQQGIEKMGFEEFCVEVLYPFLQKVGVMWMASTINPAQEHFISNLIIQKLYVAIDGLYCPKKKKAKAVCFLREGELHEMGLLFYRYLLKKRGVETIYLGQSVPLEDLKQVVNAHNPEYLVTAFVATMDEGMLEKYIKELSKAFTNRTIIVSGHQITQIERNLPKNVVRCNNVEEFVKYADKSIKA